jgi:hypothetical protein
MRSHGYCAHSRTAADVVGGILDRFPREVEAHLAHGRCPHPEGRCRPFDRDSIERAAIEAALDAAVAQRSR